jgi:hypothetical protein
MRSQPPHTQLPLKDEALAFGVAGDTLTVAAELGRWCGSWRRARVPWRNSSMRRPPPKTAVHIAVARPPPLNCPPSNSPGEREGGNGFALAGAAGGSGFRRSRSFDMEEACCGHVINEPKNCWLSLYVRD